MASAFATPRASAVSAEGDHPNRHELSVLTKQPVRLLIVDRDSWVRRTLVAELCSHADLEVVSSLEDPAELPAVLAALPVDVVLLSACDLSDELLGIAAEVTAPSRHPRVAVFTDTCDDATVLAARSSGATCFLVRADEFDLGIAVKATAAGSVLMSPTAGKAADSMVAKVVAQHALRPAAELDALPAQRRRVLVLVAQGEANNEIAGQLHISRATVRYHVSQLLQQFSKRDRGQLMAFAYAHGLYARPEGAETATD